MAATGPPELAPAAVDRPGAGSRAHPGTRAGRAAPGGPPVGRAVGRAVAATVVVGSAAATAAAHPTRAGAGTGRQRLALAVVAADRHPAAAVRLQPDRPATGRTAVLLLGSA